MYDPNDVIAYLYPHKGEGFDGAAFATSIAKNQARFLAARNPHPPKPRDVPSRQERAGTELPVEREDLENLDCLVLLFSHGARTGVGLVLGHAASADVAVPKLPGVSTFHLALTFDDRHRLIAKDLGSTGGTKVTYNGEEGERVSNFEWLLQGPSIVRGKPPVLNLTDLVQFKVVVPPRDVTSPEYIDRVKRFRMGTAEPDELFASFILFSAPGTRLPTGQQTPLRDFRSRPIFYREELGRGAYGIVKYVWNLTTGDEYVVKKPLLKLIENNKVDIKFWKEEAAIMARVSHAHIVTFRNATFSPWPELEFEYVPGGSLDAHHNLSTFESTQVLCQLSSALEYLHNQQPSIGHRDIKPENILVAERGTDGIYVKFADFGLSKAANALKTFCGTLEWAAPEIYLKAANLEGTVNDTYSVAVDIWSLGVVVASLECGLPRYEVGWQTSAVAWIHAVQEHIAQHYQKHRSDLLCFVLDNMLVEDPEERSSADYCHDEALRLLQRVTDTQRQEHGSTTLNPPVVLAAQALSASQCTDDSEASTFRLDLQPPSSPDSSETQIRETVELISSSPIENSGYCGRTLIGPLVHQPKSEEWQRSTAPDPETPPSKVPDTTSVVLPQGSMTDGLLWNSKAASLTSEHSVEATEDGHGEAQTNDRPKEQDSIVSPVYYHLSGEVPGGAAEEPRQVRKRSWPADASPSVSLPRSLTHPLLRAPQRAVNREIASSKGPSEPDPKRSKRGD